MLLRYIPKLLCPTPRVGALDFFGCAPLGEEFKYQGGSLMFFEDYPGQGDYPGGKVKKVHLSHTYTHKDAQGLFYEQAFRRRLGGNGERERRRERARVARGIA